MKKMKNYLLMLVLACVVMLMPKTNALAVSGAVDLVLDGQTWVTQTLNNDSDTLWYRVVMPEDGKLDMTFQAFRNSTYFHFLNEDLVDTTDDRYFRIQINSGTATAPGSETKSVYLSKGTYYIKTEDNQYMTFAGVGDVRIKAAFTPAGTTDIEPNGTWATAMPLAAEKTVRGILTEKDDREDFYRIQVPEKGKATFHLASWFWSAKLELYSDEYATLLSEAVNNGSETTPVVKEFTKELTPGTYYIKIEDNVYGDKNGATGVYELKWQMEIPVQSVSLDSQSLVLTEGDYRTLYASITPANATNQTLSWESSNENVVSVDSNGNLTARKAGTAVITVRSADGNGISAQCSITVKEKINPPSQVTGLTSAKADRKTTSVTLSWSAVSSASGYRVYKYNSSTNAYEMYKDVSGTKLKVIGLNPETAYSFKVAAYKTGADGAILGEESAVYSVYTAPKKLKATVITSKKTVKKTASKYTVQLKWKKVSGATGYKVYYKTSGSWKLLKTTKATSLKTTVAKGKSRYFRVAAYRTKNGLTTIGKYSAKVKYSAK